MLKKEQKYRKLLIMRCACVLLCFTIYLLDIHGIMKVFVFTVGNFVLRAAIPAREIAVQTLQITQLLK